ncbi:MAG: T9SS type A sorting domain-containing protein, partial [Chitinophagaceae bacterium]|nr:T9SS type A sorting domain-containing protein [Chitinophagaceae bacterium]
IDTTGNPVPPTPPVDTIPTTNPDTTVTPVPPGDSTDKPARLKVYPNPLNVSSFHVGFFNSDASNDISLEIFDPRGVLVFRRQYGQMPKGNNAVPLNTFETNLKSGLYFVTMKVGGKAVQSVKLIRIRY